MVAWLTRLIAWVLHLVDRVGEVEQKRVESCLRAGLDPYPPRDWF